MSMHRSLVENIADWFLGIFITAPTFVGMILWTLTAPYCDGWNEGSMAGTCVIPGLEVLYNSFNNIGFLYGISFLLLGPIALLAAVLSAIRKIARYWKGYRPQSKRDILLEIGTGIPILLLAWTSFGIFGEI